MNPSFTLQLRSVTHYQSQIHIDFDKSFGKSGEEDCTTVEHIQIMRNGQLMMSIKNFAAILHGWSGSYNSNQYRAGMNEVVCCGDFVFAVRNLGQSWENVIHTGKVGDLWLIDKPHTGMEVDLNQRNGYSVSMPEFPEPPVHLIRSGEVSMPRGLETTIYHCWDSLFEIVITHNPYLFTEYGSYRNGQFYVKAPPRWDSCNGAARIHYKEEAFRWIFADENGHYTWAQIQEVLERTTDVDDWQQLKNRNLADATHQELQTVREHFEEVYTAGRLEEHVFADIQNTLSGLLML